MTRLGVFVLGLLWKKLIIFKPLTKLICLPVMMRPTYCKIPLHTNPYDEKDAGTECDPVARVVDQRPDVVVGEEEVVGEGKVISHNLQHGKYDMQTAIVKG